MILVRNDKRIAISFYLILYTYEDSLKYDYTIPDIGVVSDMIRKSVEALVEIPQDFRDEIYSAIAPRGGQYGPFASELENIMCSSWIFGREWFHGEGSFYRWRSEAIRKQATSESHEILSVNDVEMLFKISQKMKEIKINYEQTKENK